jgi:hypothetical protein
MSIQPAHDEPRPRTAEGFSDAVTVAFGDERADVYGVARLGLADTGASGLVLLFRGGEPVAVQAEGGVDAGDPASWDEVSVAGLRARVIEPLRAWRLGYDGEEASLDLELHAVGALAELPEDDPVAKSGGMTGYDQVCRVTGSATLGGTRIALDGLGQRGRSWGAPDWRRISLTRTIGVWLGGDLDVSVAAVRPSGARHHEDERVAATILDVAPEGGEPRATRVADPRVSTTYDAEGRQRAAGLELYVEEDASYPRRAAGEVVCGTTLDLGRLQLHCAFFRWRMEGRTGVGRYDVLRRTG